MVDLWKKTKHVPFQGFVPYSCLRMSGDRDSDQKSSYEENHSDDTAVLGDHNVL